ncbi:hypothetical protein [Aeromonas veronii]|uniref:hypothetical protein n=1 Tax=Aeromonas veronii TaxID=654 RepID=UPI001BCE7C40|nr:hypothetical protein [Aeromonas veronii]MBS4725142.1 hypothetical protein [Aeromonas veronii]
MTTSEQEGCTTEMVYGADNAALKLIFQVKKEALRQFQNQLIALRKEQKPSTNVAAVRSLLFACREERAGANFAFEQIESNERFIEEMRQLWENCPFSMSEETIK